MPAVPTANASRYFRLSTFTDIFPQTTGEAGGYGCGSVSVRCQNHNELAIAKHCNLRPPGVAPVVLSFNCAVHNAPAYKFNNSARDISAIGKY